MKPNMIRAEMMIREISTTDIGKRLGCRRQDVARVIRGDRRTAYIRKGIADAIGKPVAVIWSEEA